MKAMICSLVLNGVFIAGALAGAPAFHNTATPEGWTFLKGEVAAGNTLESKGGGVLELRTTEPLTEPFEATIRFRVSLGDAITVRALEEEAPLLESTFLLNAANHGKITAKSSGKPMATDAVSSRLWLDLDNQSGALNYLWRFPKVKNLWDDQDYREIGAAFAQMVPFEEKVFAFRLVLTGNSRQIWMDDRLVAEDRASHLKPVRLEIQIAKTTKVVSVEFSAPTGGGRFHPLALDEYSHSKPSSGLKPEATLVQSIPMLVPKAGNPDINLGDSLFRYRLTNGSGPDCGYVDAAGLWPGSFQIDPAHFTFRVPYRSYQNVWLLAWVGDQPNTVPKASLRFFRERAGYPASSDLEISEEAIKKGLVTKLAQKTAEGKQLYLVKVPVDTNGLYGMSDMAGQFLEFQLSKPVALGRAYPDPISYWFSPAGLPSSLHVVGITLEEAPFSFSVEPKQTGFVFERPEMPELTLSVTNTTDKALEATATVRSKSFSESERASASGKIKILPGQVGQVALSLDLKLLGWHELQVTVAAGGVERVATLSLVLLPPNSRTYGVAPNETRFGIWPLTGHYNPPKKGDFATSERLLEMYRRLGLRRVNVRQDFVPAEMAQRHDFLPKGPHTEISLVYHWKDEDAEAQQKAVDAEVVVAGQTANGFPESSYFYGGEWHIGKDLQYAPWPGYTGDGDRELTDEERGNTERQIRIFTAIGKAIRAKYPQTKLIMQWGSPLGSIAFMRAGMSRELVDEFGMDVPMFELMPEVSNMTGSINNLWALREEAKRMGWPRLPIRWCEGPFFPTNPGGLTETQQAEYQIRYWLLGLAYGVGQFEGGVVTHDAGNYYGTEHYGAGIFHRIPLENPKPAVAVVATATSMLCGADPIGGVDTGCLTSYCLAFQKPKTQEKVFALWRVNGTVSATLKVKGAAPTLTDSMGNATLLPVHDGAVEISLSSMPVWLTGVEQIEGFSFGTPQYKDSPAAVTRPLAAMSASKWTYDGSEDKQYATNHFGVRRITDPKLAAEFGPGDEHHPEAVSITLPVEQGNRPLANRYGAVIPKSPILIPGRATALGMWVKGNSSWGRIVYQLRDAHDEIWTAVGKRGSWNCDDPFGASYISFEGWRYVRIPMPGNQPYDASRDLETTGWGSREGDGIVDLPLRLEKIFVEARNEVPVVGEMRLVPDRSYKLSGLVAEYPSEEEASPAAIVRNQVKMPKVEWSGPVENPIAQLAVLGTVEAPVIKTFVEPSHFNDGRKMHIRFDQDKSRKYNLYLSRYPDGHGAQLILAGVVDEQLVGGLRPEFEMYFFLTSVGDDKKESKPSAAFKLTTMDNFMEK